MVSLTSFVLKEKTKHSYTNTSPVILLSLPSPKYGLHSSTDLMHAALKPWKKVSSTDPCFDLKTTGLAKRFVQVFPVVVFSWTNLNELFGQSSNSPVSR